MWEAPVLSILGVLQLYYTPQKLVLDKPVCKMEAHCDADAMQAVSRSCRPQSPASLPARSHTIPATSGRAHYEASRRSQHILAYGGYSEPPRSLRGVPFGTDVGGASDPPGWPMLRAHCTCTRPSAPRPPAPRPANLTRMCHLSATHASSVHACRYGLRFGVRRGDCHGACELP